MEEWKTWAVFTVIYWVGALLWASVALEQENINAAWGAVLVLFFAFAIFGTVKMIQALPPAGSARRSKRKNNN